MTQAVEAAQARGVCTPELYESALRCCAKLGEWKKGLKLLREMGRLPNGASRFAYNLALEAAANAQKLSAAMDLYGEMLQSASLQPNVFTYSPLLSLCAKLGDGERALRLLEEMKGRGVAGNAFTYTATIDACERAGMRGMTDVLLREMRALGVGPTVVTYNAIIARRAERPEAWGEALEWLEELEASDVKPDRMSYAAAMNAAERAYAWDRVVELADRAGSLADVAIVSRQINAFVKLERWREAREAMDRMRERGLRPDEVAYTLVIKACTLGGQPHQALRYFREMTADGIRPNVISYSAAMEACRVVSGGDLGVGGAGRGLRKDVVGGRGGIGRRGWTSLRRWGTGA
jgi:pentatricopeptide repeat domain-containing protein 1